MTPLTLSIVRSLATLVLGTLVFVAFFAFLLESNLSGKLLDEGFYAGILDDHDTYNRVYDEVLPSAASQLTGDLQLIPREDAAMLVREVMPPEYLQAQVETAIENTVAYFNHERDTLEVYIDLGGSLDRIGPAVSEYVDERIDQMEVVQPDPTMSREDQVADAERRVRRLALDLYAGRTPESVPSLTVFTEQRRRDMFERFVASQVDNTSLDPAIRRGLENNLEELRREFVNGDSKEFLRAATGAMVPLAVEDATTEVRSHLDAQGRWDLAAAIAEQDGRTGEPGLQARAAEVRDRIDVVRTLGGPVALAVVIAGSVALGLVHLPDRRAVLRWPGVVLLVTGTVVFIAGKVLEAVLPARLEGLLDQASAEAPAMPPAALDLVTEILRSFGVRLVQGIGDPALVLMVVGGILLAASFAVRWVSPSVPFFGKQRESEGYSQSPV